MKLAEIGEFGFIERFKPWFGGLVQGEQMGIGDDCAIIPSNEMEDWLVTTDMLMEEVHFLRGTILPEQLGFKSLAVSLSDIAAMGGTPVGSFLSIAIPVDVEVEYLDCFMQGYHRLSEKYNTPLLGGDTTRSLKHLTINVCVIGKCPKGKARKRNMAQVGDIICVTGNLGDSAGGLQVLIDKLPLTEENNYLLLKHYLPEPQLKEGAFLANRDEVHAMMDISDGIASDLRHILKASGVAAQIQLEQLPVSKQLIALANNHKINATELAVGGGEDYELLITVAKENIETIQEQFLAEFGKPLIQIGTITIGTPEIIWYKNDNQGQLSKKGFNHFQ